ncbi:MAG: response regulator transcription factor [Chloroflexi bacterium]|jgi:DNA-binding response OmpR family regulator|nr:response regulator transcription factor [Anaerolineaceae bacterium]NLI45234.1 response regulator transcription factor [Chloroflexota bacterium]HOE34905.1 response regulator transcription factor [Anaerolineaceae bacterium]HOT26300.1 response regulator transcription factor [Anaerolineaceae bacterium]HQK03866.1 response regulator transcription factor [Anaerolineaceae bacterium]
MTRKILVVDDTRNVQLMLQEFLLNQNFSVSLASDGKEAMEKVREERPDLILLDVMMPGMDGFQFLSRLRTESELPVIMITAKQQEADIIRGFELGADDYITKPFKLRELLMRIRAVMRRSVPAESEKPSVTIGDLTLNRDRHELRKQGEIVELTPLEFLLMDILMTSSGKVVRREDLCLRLMDHGFAGSESTIKIHIHNLRLKLEDDLVQPKYIETVFGIGYRFLENES